eukprot:scpid26435/ scgid14865/ Probable inactive purple acid phosphatase 27
MTFINSSRSCALLAVLCVIMLYAPLPSHGQLYWDTFNSSIESGQNLTVRFTVPMWHRLPDYVDRLRIRVFCPVRNGSETHGHILEYSFVSTLRQDAAQRSGTLSLGPIVGLGTLTTYCEFVVVKRRAFGNLVLFLPIHSLGTQIFAVNSPPVGQVRLSLLRDAKRAGMKVMWKVFADNVTSASVTYFRSDRPEKTFQADASRVDMYSQSDLPGKPANIERPDYYRSPGNVHQARLTSLDPHTEYTYMIDGDTRTRSFRTPRSPQPTHRAHIAAFGNMGVFDQHAHAGKHGVASTPSSAAVRSFMHRLAADFANPAPSAHRPDLVIHLGNLAYSSGRSFVWDYFLNQIQPVAEHVPYHVVAGEREVAIDNAAATDKGLAAWASRSNKSGGEGGVPLSHLFSMPGSTTSNGVFWYSHALANAYLVYISTEHDVSPGSAQFTWLEAELSSVDRSQYPWLIVAGHRPIFNGQTRPASHDSAGFDETALRRTLHALMHKHHVNVYLSAYFANYVRTCPLDGSERCVTDGKSHGVVHMTCGTAGAPLETTPIRQEAWIEAHLSEYGYCDIQTKSRDRAMLRFRSVTGKLSDHSTLLNNVVVETQQLEQHEPVVIEQLRAASSSASAADGQRSAFVLVVAVLLSLLLRRA